jgi:DNA (cytosine-5)-methyltransferase 1
MRAKLSISAIDLFCGAGGLSLGLQSAGIQIAAGIDLDPSCSYPYEKNLKAKFIQKDISEVDGKELMGLWHKNSVRLLAGCAPCQPFSSHRRGVDTSKEDSWNLLDHFARLIRETSPEFVTMENVNGLGKTRVFERFVRQLRSQDYVVDYGSVYGPRFGLPQERRRLVLVASRIGAVQVPEGHVAKGKYKSVRAAIGSLPALNDGESDPKDLMHTARSLSPTNLKRMRASTPGGDWTDWPRSLRSKCHTKKSGSSFKSFYGRMLWDQPSPTITTQSYNFGTGRFGHPEQDRSLTLREAAILQGFPRHYQFVPKNVRPSMQTVGRLIGNAVPPPFGKAVGKVFISNLKPTR